MKAIEVANELKKIVATMEANPDMAMPRVSIVFSCDTAEEFKSMARILPHPLTKGVDFEGKTYADKTLTYNSGAMTMKAVVPMSKVCRLISPAVVIPAKYECEPILSPEEDAELEQAVLA